MIEWEEEKRERGGVVCDGGVRGVGALRERERERDETFGRISRKERGDGTKEREREEDSVRSERERERALARIFRLLKKMQIFENAFRIARDCRGQPGSRVRAGVGGQNAMTG